MRTFVLSGGGNMGPLQIGAMRALFERDIMPDMLVGCSAGSLNAAPVAQNPCLDTIDELAANWRSTRLSDVYPGPRAMALLRLMSGKDSLYTNRNMYALLQRCGISPAHTFGNYATTPLYITATDLRTGGLKVFGDDMDDRVLDAMMSSTALTPFHPPWEVNGERYVDGGTVTPLPLRTALERGATEIYALHIWDTNTENTEPGLVRGVVGVMARSVDSMLRLQAQHDLLLAQHARVRLHYIRLSSPHPLPLTDFDHTDELIDAGYEAATNYLDATPLAPPRVVPGQAEAASAMRRVGSWLGRGRKLAVVSNQ